MTITHKYAAYKALDARFREHPDTPAYSDYVDPRNKPPYYHYFWTGGGEVNNLNDSHQAEHVFIVKAVTTSMDAAFVAEANLVTWFDDMGTQDVTTGYLDAGTDWTITATMQEGAIHQVVQRAANTTQEYHDGFYLRILMGRIT